MDNRGRRQKRQVTAPATRADRQPDGGRRQKAVLAVLEDRKSAGGQSAGVDVLRVRGSVQRGLRGTAVDFRKRVLQQLNG